MLTVAVICPNLKCKRTLQVPVINRGQVVRCKHCATTFVVPDDKPKPDTAEAGR